MKSPSSKYELRGVSATKDEVHNAIKDLDKGLYPTAFCKILPDFVGSHEQFCNIMHADTAGTKTSLAYLYWKQTGLDWVWSNIVQDAMVMNLDDMACVGCVDNIVLSSTIGRNKNLISGEVIKLLIQGTSDFIAKLAEFGVNVHLAGGETADVGDIVRTLDVGFTTFARMKRSDLIVNDIQAGDVILGLASDGQSIYEETYNSGIGSNGLTAARHDVLSKYYVQHYPDSYDHHTPEEVVFTGPYLLTDQVPGFDDMDVGSLLLSPTRTFIPVLKQIYAAHHQDIHGVIHCTGGGQTKVSKFIQNKHIIKNNLFDIPPVFKLIQGASNTAWREMYQVFNMGHRMEIYTKPEIASEIIEIAESFDIGAQIIGEVKEWQGNKVTIESPTGVFEY
ncbi:MAG: phosphoribosylformylglycinamidine cyclo-ligase [Saprospiraceae bacterium]|nr:phosphoribosylformylglycinamidine cyclo-ligase [Saprospiraceae bacterium]